MSRISWAILLASGTLFVACTREKEVPKGPDGKPMVSRQADPDRVVFETDLEVPKDLRSKIKKTDLMIWDIKNDKGEVVAARITPVPEFPAKVTVMARQLIQPIPEGTQLLFTARIVKFGDEGKPPEKGQLTAMVGTEPDQGKVVENAHVNQKQLDKFLKKKKITPLEAEDLHIGAKVHAVFAPSLM